MMWPKCLAILSVQINGGKDCAPPKKTKEKGDVHFFAMVIYYEKFQLFCVVHFQNATYLLFKVHLRRGIIIICPSPPYCNLHTIVKGNLQWIQNGFHICHLKRLHCTQAIFNYCIVFLQQFFTLRCHDIKRLQFSVRGASDQISPLHCKCLIFQPILDWIDSNVCPVV